MKAIGRFGLGLLAWAITTAAIAGGAWGVSLISAADGWEAIGTGALVALLLVVACFYVWLIGCALEDTEFWLGDKNTIIQNTVVTNKTGDRPS